MKISNVLLIVSGMLGMACNASTEIETVPYTPGIQVDNGKDLTFTAEQLRLPGKKGACFTLKEGDASYETNLKRMKGLNPKWNYSWGPNYVSGQPDYVEFIPMAFGKIDPDSFLATVSPFVESGHIRRVLGFNEPEAAEQGNLTVDEALNLWPALQTLGVPLGSPAPASYSGTWIDQFMQGVEERGYRVDYMCVHNYGGGNAESFKNLIKSIYDKYQRPILITEFAIADWNAKSPADNKLTAAKALAFMKEVLPWLEEQEYVYGYAWFPFGTDSEVGWISALYDENNELTELGEYYAAFPDNVPGGDGGDEGGDGGEEGGDEGGDDEPFDGGLVVDGDFEVSGMPSWTGKSNAAWLSIANGSVGVINGNGTLRLNNAKWSSISQTLSNVVPGSTYECGAIGRAQRTGGEAGTENTGQTLFLDVMVDGKSALRLQWTTSDNTPQSGEVTIPASAASVSIRVWAEYSVGYIDDIYLRLKE